MKPKTKGIVEAVGNLLIAIGNAAKETVSDSEIDFSDATHAVPVAKAIKAVWDAATAKEA